MEQVLKGWITDNTVTGEDKGDKILVLESAGNLTLDDVIDEMRKEDTGLRRETMRHVVDLYNRKTAELLLAGYSVNTGLFRAVPQFTGLIENGVWNPLKNGIYILLQQDKVLRDAIARTIVKILGIKANSAFIIGGQDVATRATDGTVTPGRNYHISGRNIKIVGTDPTVGVYIVDSKGAKRKLDADMIALNNPSDVIILLPADLEEGTCELQLITQYCSGGKELKVARILTRTITIGAGGDDGEVIDPTS